MGKIFRKKIKRRNNKVTSKEKIIQMSTKGILMIGHLKIIKKFPNHSTEKINQSRETPFTTTTETTTITIIRHRFLSLLVSFLYQIAKNILALLDGFLWIIVSRYRHLIHR